MAELNCAVCDKEVGFQGQIKLSDGTFICRDCEKKVSPFFEPSESTLETYKGNLKQNEEGKKLYDAYFSKNRKAIGLCENHVIYDPGTALVCIFGDRGGIFGRKRFYNVFPLADIGKYEQADRFQRKDDGSNQQISCVYLSFKGVRTGLSTFLIPADSGDIKKLKKEFDRILLGYTKGNTGVVNKTKAREELTQRAETAISEVLKDNGGM